MNKKNDMRAVISGLVLLEHRLLVIQEIIRKELELAEKEAVVMLLKFGSKDNIKI